jgi:5-methylcytosine-specific restriction endonuclease McrA
MKMSLTDKSPIRQKAIEKMNGVWPAGAIKISKTGRWIWHLDIKDRLSEAQNHRCCYCGCRMAERNLIGYADERLYAHNYRDNYPTFEHVIPLSLGGEDILDNIVIACLKCNVERSYNYCKKIEG